MSSNSIYIYKNKGGREGQETNNTVVIAVLGCVKKHLKLCLFMSVLLHLNRKCLLQTLDIFSNS